MITGSLPGEELQVDLETRKRAFLLKPFRGDELLRKLRELSAPGFDRDPAPPTLQVAVHLVRCT
jgi:hypothetical protein